jgi:hypothetical protein
MRGRPAVTAAALLGVVLASFAAYRYHDARTGPFQFWTLRAGLSFAALDDEEHAATKRRFVCKPIGEDGRFCQLHGRKLKGMLRLFVGPDGRAAVVQFWPDEDNSLFADESRRLAAEWTLLRTPASDGSHDGDGGAITSLWRTEDRRWSATIQYGCLGATPTVIEVADDAAVADFIARQPDTRALLTAARVIAPRDEADVSVAPRRAPGECGRATFIRPST